MVPVQSPLATGPNFNSLIDVLLMKKYSWGPEGGAPTIEDVPAEEMEKATAMHKALVEAAAEHDETLMEKFFEQDSLTEDEMREGIRKGLASRGMFPVFCVCAGKDMGVRRLMEFLGNVVPFVDEMPPVHNTRGEVVKPDMKNIFKLTALAVFLCCLVSCDDDEPIIPTLEVTPANLNGTWELSEWNGAPLAEGTYCYITFNRKEQTFEMYQKFDSMYARYITGSFSIKNDPYLGAVISGEYDFGNGEWNNKYIVTDLLESGSMIWTAKDNENDVNKYIRCEKVPENIIAEAKVDKGE